MKTKIFIALWLSAVFTIATAQVTQINSNQSLEPLTNLNDEITLFSSSDGTLWVSEGTLASTVQLNSNISFATSGALLGNKYIFAGFTAATGIELFITDGTPVGTILLKDIISGTTGSTPNELTYLNGIVYFTAETPAEGLELWRTDGTPTGTTLVKDINPGPLGSNDPFNFGFTPLGNNLIFSAEGNANGTELWKTDGTPEGTVMLKDINPGTEDGNPGLYWRLDNLIIFTAKTEANGFEFWRTDGTEAGTFLLKDINPGPASSAFAEVEILPGVFFPFPFVSGFNIFNGKAYFQATDGVSNGNIYSTDGTIANTQLLKNIIPGTDLPIILLFGAVNLPGKFIFSVADEAGVALWQSDGTSNGTNIFKSFFLNSTPDIPFLLKDYSNYSEEGSPANSNTPLFQGNKFFFYAPTEAEGNELWISDGTIEGTNLVKNIGPGNLSGISDNITYLNTTNGLFFAANDGTTGNELWRSDGTSAGTTLVQDINTGVPDALPTLSLMHNGKIYFSAKDGNESNLGQNDLFVINGNFTPLPAKLTDFTVVQKDADALLHWKTLQEINTSHYSVERSNNGVNFQAIGTVASNKRANQSYHFTDYKIAFPPSGKLYYRLVTNDRDGTKSFSKVVAISGKSSLWNAKLLNSGLGSETKLQISGQQKPFTVRLSDQAGKIIYTKQYNEYENFIDMNVKELPRGLYFVTVYYGNETKTLRFIW